MLKIDGRVQREGEVVHLIAYKLEDLSPLLASLGQRQTPFALPRRRIRPLTLRTRSAR